VLEITLEGDKLREWKLDNLSLFATKWLLNLKGSYARRR
jgi:hypothetical protein